MGASESTERSLDRRAGAQQENRNKEGADVFSRAIVIGAAAILAAAGAVAVLSSDSNSKSPIQRKETEQTAGKWAKMGAAAIMAGGAVAVLSSDSNFASERDEVEQCEKWAEVGTDYTIPKLITLISWEPPSIGWMKINTDGSGKGAAGGLIRDFKGQWIKGFMSNFGYGATSTVAELWGVMRGLELAWRFGCKKLIVETDCKSAIQMIQNPRNRQDYNYELVRAIVELKERDWEVHFQFCYREGNRCADWLAKHGIKAQVGEHELSQPPLDLVSLLEQDSMGVALPRLC